MILLDTDHFTVIGLPSDSRYPMLAGRMQRSTEGFAVTVVTLEEQARGWLAAINRRSDVEDQVAVYDRLLGLYRLVADWQVVRFDERAAREFRKLRKAKVRMGTQDLKIAAISLVNDALLLTANLRDFKRVPGLRVENWLV
jgi:tRNA(fMet)-specific endonuclease VapC